MTTHALWEAISPEHLRELYTEQLLTMREIARQFGVYPMCVKRKLEHYQIPIRRVHERNVRRTRDQLEYFRNWSPSMAYLLGLFLTDGYVHGRRLGIEVIDRELVELIAGELGHAHIGYRAERGIYCWQMCSGPLVDRLAEFEITERKSLTVRYPESIHPEYERYFIRGVFDGNGCVHRSGRYASAVFASASARFMETLVEKLGAALDQPPARIHIAQQDADRPPIYRASYYRTAARRLFDYLYDGVGPYLARKYVRFTELLTDY